MTLHPPSTSETLERLDRLGFDVSREEAETFRTLVAETLETYERTDDLAEPDERRPAHYLTREDHGPVDAADDPLNAWIRRCRVEGADEGLLADLTVALKDNVSLAGIPMSCGTRVLRGHTPRIDATIVTRMLDEGATITGITNMDAFAFSGVGDTGDYGPTFNPHDPERYAGGSSAGSAAVVGDGEVDVAIGGDQGGSVRIPAAWSGCVGHKPTHGLVPYTGIFRVDNTIDHVGPFGRRVEDVARCLEAIAGPDPLDPRQRDPDVAPYTERLDDGVEGLAIGVLEDGFGLDPSEPEVDGTVRDAVGEFEDLGATVESVNVPEHADAMPVWLPIIVEGAAASLTSEGEGYGWEGFYDTTLAETLSKFRSAAANDLPFNVKVAALVADYVSDRYHGGFYGKAQNLRRSFTAAYDDVLDGVDLLALPTTPMRAFEHDPERSDADTFRHALVPALNTCAFNTTGHPAVSVPCGKPGGLPVGLMLVGSHFDDATVLTAARAFEGATEWERRG
jgi:amidase